MRLQKDVRKTLSTTVKRADDTKSGHLLSREIRVKAHKQIEQFAHNIGG